MSEDMMSNLFDNQDNTKQVLNRFYAAKNQASIDLLLKQVKSIDIIQLKNAFDSVKDKDGDSVHQGALPVSQEKKHLRKLIAKKMIDRLSGEFMRYDKIINTTVDLTKIKQQLFNDVLDIVCGNNHFLCEYRPSPKSPGF